MKNWVLILGLGFPLFATAQIPRPVIPDGVGVNIHFIGGHERDLDLIQAAGFKFVRMDFQWTATEKKRGEYDWSGYDELTANLDKRGIRALYILDYSNPLYDAASPQRPESIAAFAKWAGAAAKHFRGRKIIWEIWNEPNGGFWAPKPDAAQYSALALATGKAIRAADKHATIVGPAMATFAWDFLEAVFKSGALEYFDAVTVHPYRSPSQPPETAAPEYARLRELIDRYAPASRKGKIPILSGEWGYSTHTKGVSLETQAAFAVRQQLSNLLNHIPLSIWYDWKNDGNDPNENEHNFGTMTPDLKPKPAYVALQTLTRELSGYRIEARLALTNLDDYVLAFTNDMGGRKLVVWNMNTNHCVTLPITIEPGGKYSSTSWDGKSWKWQPREDGGYALQLQPRPRYLTLKPISQSGAARPN